MKTTKNHEKWSNLTNFDLGAFCASVCQNTQRHALLLNFPKILNFQIEIFKLVWAVWRKIERNTMSALVFGQKCYDDKILLLSDKVACQVDKFSMDVSEFWKTDLKTISR